MAKTEFKPEPVEQPHPQNEQLGNMSWWATVIQITPDMTRQQFTSLAKLSFETELDIDAMHLLMTSSRKFNTDLDSTEKHTFYWAWDRVIRRKLKVWRSFRNAELLAIGEKKLSDDGFSRASIATNIWKICQHLLIFVRECMNAYTHIKPLVYYRTILAEIYWIMSIVLDGLEGGTEVNGVTITDCTAIAYATYKQTEVLQTQNLSNLVSDSLLFVMSYSKFLREKLGEEDESLKVVTKVFEQVRLCERHNKKVVADERGAFILQILQINLKELKYRKELKNKLKTNLTLHSP